MYNEASVLCAIDYMSLTRPFYDFVIIGGSNDDGLSNGWTEGYYTSSSNLAKKLIYSRQYLPEILRTN